MFVSREIFDLRKIDLKGSLRSSRKFFCFKTVDSMIKIKITLNLFLGSSF